ncbi:MAG: efflux RND transporter periplasmic adaptor subunit [Schwartzia sp.]|nr:efflux RND transporter periplasmic adaptor subunit [Schwartzia sp. (in: firmicutes)]
MKRYFMAGLGIVLALSLGAIFYGAWLNERGEVQITRRMEERRLTLHGAKAASRRLSPRLTVNSVNLFSNDMADAVALVDGRIVEVRAPKGSSVRRGDVIFVLENENIPLQRQEAESGILRAQAELKRAENNYSRYKILKDNDAASAQQYDEAEAAYFSAQSSLGVAEAKAAQLGVQESRQQVVAPIDGRVLVLYRPQGAYVQAGTSLALVGDFHSLYFTAPVGDEDARYLTVGQEAELVFQSKDFQKVYGTDYAAGNLGDRQTFTATIAQITPPLTEAAAMRNILWQVDNRSGLLEPQTYGSVSFQSRRSHDALAVPLSAVADGANASVFVAKDNGTIERRTVRTGTNDGAYIEVLSGLSEGEVVVTSGMEGLADGVHAEIIMDETEAIMDETEAGKSEGGAAK